MRTRYLRVAVPAALCAALIVPAVGYGHAAIKSFSPKRGSVVSRDLKYVRINFESRIAGGRISVRNASGTKVSRGDGGVVRGGRQLRTRLNGGLRAGRYSASARYVNTDGHVQTKSWSFRLR
jgi:methionine-rich copper-binding protein CopC